MTNHPLHHAPLPQGLFWSLVAFALLSAILSAAPPPTVVTQNIDMKAVEAAILKEDWNRVAALLKDVSDDPKKSPDPVLRLIKGHACLALNRNNEATCLFLSVQSKEACQAWRRWSEDFAARNSHSAVGWLFKGDSLARVHLWDQSIAAFDEAMRLSPSNAMALNARGVARASRGDYRGARVDFTDAVVLSEGHLADAQANIGALCLQRKDGAPGGLRAFNEALKLSPDFVLALHGRSCVKTLLGQLEGANTDLRRTEVLNHNGNTAALILANVIRYKAFWSGMDPNELLAMVGSGNKAGTTFDARIGTQPLNSTSGDGSPRAFQAWEQRWQHYTSVGHSEPGQFGQNNFNRQAQAFQQLTPDDQNRAIGQMRIDITNNPTLARNEAQDRLNYTVHNSTGGFAQQFNQIALPMASGMFALAPEPTTGTKVAALALTTTAAHNEIMRNIHQENASTLNSRLGQPGNLVGAMSRAEMQAKMQDFMHSQAHPEKFGGPGGIGGPGHDMGRAPGGVDIAMTVIKWDNGCWPFVGYFSLAFSNQCKDIPVNEVLKTVASRGKGSMKQRQP